MSFNGYFPEEIWREILAGLAVKSLLRFRCVSRTWRKIIDSPDFISKHLIHYNSITIFNEINNNLANDDYYFHISTLENNLETAPNQSIDFIIHQSVTTFYEALASPVMNIGYGFEACASVDGLILIRHSNHLRLWNPSIRKALVFPPLGRFRDLYTRYAVGFAPSSKEYKVVVFEFDKLYVFLWVYGLNSGGWHRSCRGAMNGVEWNNCEISFESVSTKGAAHRLISFVREGRYSHVLSFDFDAQEFSLLELPDGGKDMLSMHFLLEESVAVLGISTVRACIWIMDMQGGQRSWTKWYSGDTTSTNEYMYFSGQQRAIRNVLYVKNNGDFYITMDGVLVSYNIRRLYEYHWIPKSVRSIVYMATHAESLLLHKGFEAKALSTPFPL